MAETAFKSLMDYVDEVEAETYTSEDTGAYRISGRNEAEYRIKEYQQITQQIADSKKAAADYVEEATKKANEWLDKELNSLVNRKQFLESILRDYAEEQLKDSKKKSLKLIGGTLAFRKPAPKVDYDDNVLRKYLFMNAVSFLKKQEPKVDHAELKKAAEIRGDKMFLNGKEIPGVTVTQLEAPTFSIK